MANPENTLRGISSMATRHVLSELAARYHSEGLGRIEIESVGGVDALKRVSEGERFDLVWLAADAIEKLDQGGHVVPGSRVDLMRSDIWVAVPGGAAHPPIDTEAAVRQAVLRARTLGYSTGPSGVYLAGLFQRWGIAQDVAPRLVQAPPGVPVGTLIARGQIELGFQQRSELIDIEGIDVLGPLPPDIQKTTVFAGVVCATSEQPGAARALLAFMASPDSAATLRKHGMEPA
ncbi:substrate-binding domain-containing protein [Dyella sp. C9]|uniref:substrate-binding domain-containing protein n=1 Tax=Dyella sp. C9 TaxID=2202154 RepID=UPI000DEF16F6|nr:substrate-binding domain-containing protein [Dyella sp. C9]